MAIFRYVVPAVAMAGALGVSAASSSCSAATTTIQSQSDASALAGCPVFTGSIAIATGTTDNIALNGIQEITGSLIANNVTNMLSLSADSLETIGDSFTLESLTVLTTLSFPLLTSVDTIEWTALPALQGLSFAAGVTDVTSLTIDNTELNSLDGINLENVDMVYVTNNPFLNSINMQLEYISGSLTLNANGAELDAEFPNLEWANNMTLRNCSQVSIPSLTSINGTLGFYSGGFDSLAAPNLTTVGQSLSFVSCESLTNISMPQLTTVGGALQVANNTDLESIDGFPALETVGGALDFNGEFKNVSLPSLKDVRGAFNLQSTQNITDACTTFKKLSGPKNVIKGTYVCAGTLDDPGKTGTLPDGTNQGSTNSDTGSANSVLVPGAMGVLCVVAAVFGLL